MIDKHPARILLNNELSSKVVEHSVDGLLVIDREGIVQFANPAAIALFQDRTSVLVGFHLGAPAIDEPVEIVLPSQAGMRYLEMRATEIVWEGRGASLASLREITARRQVEQRLEQTNRALRDSEIQFRSLVEGAPYAIFVVSDDRLCYVNLPACRLFGVDLPEQVLGKPVMDCVHPSSFEVVQAIVPLLGEENKSVPPTEVAWFKLDGQTLPVEISARPISYQGKGAALVFARDITERRIAADALKRSERRYLSILEAAPDALVILNGEGIIVLVSTLAEKMFGYPRAELLGRDTAFLFAERYRNPHLQRREAYFANFPTQTLGAGIDLFGLRADGTEFPIEARHSPLETEGEKFILAAFRDVTERKAVEQKSRQLEITVAEAEAANKAKSMFLSTMSHEIRTPMNAILGYSQLMLRGSHLGADANANLKIINRNGEHLLDIINNILDMAKIEAGRLQLTPKPFDLSRLLRDLEAMFRLRAEAKTLQFEVEVTGEPVAHIVADEGKIGQVLINLLANAVKFTEHGRVVLRVRLSLRTDGRLQLSAAVEDTGVGMTVEEQSKLFQPFAQGQSGQRVYHGGTGLGLAISQGIARMMGGDITTSSQAGAGSLFLFEVPVERVSEQELPRQSVLPGRVVGLEAGQGAPRILIADDVPDNREWLSALLTSLGFDVRSVENGKAAVLEWEEWRPRLILMDMHMPVMDGLEASRRIRLHPAGKDTVIIAVTADAMEAYRKFVLESGLDAFISKPCAESELLEQIRTHLGINYAYAKEAATEANGAASAGIQELGPEQFREQHSDLIPRMREAIVHGDKARLDKMILTIAERGDLRSATALRELADRYQYDRLSEWLEKHASNKG